MDSTKLITAVNNTIITKTSEIQQIIDIFDNNEFRKKKIEMASKNLKIRYIQIYAIRHTANLENIPSHVIEQLLDLYMHDLSLCSSLIED
jgi:hypothetical protein